jgi:hypothetical protein
LNLNVHVPLSNFVFNFNLRQYNPGGFEPGGASFDESLFPQHDAILSFTGNTAHSNNRGLLVVNNDPLEVGRCILNRRNLC